METKIEWREFRFVGLVVLVVLLATSLPYAFASLTTPSDQHFMGFAFNTSDHAQYLAWYKEFQTSFSISNTLTPEPNPEIFFNLLWFALGRLGLYTGWSYIVVYQIFRWAAGAFFLGMIYVFSALFFPGVRKRRIAFLITSLGSGLGWILVVLKYALAADEVPFPLDVYVAEGNSFFCVMAYPHFAEAAGLILLVLGLLLVGERRGELRYAVLAGLSAHFLGWQHGYDLLIVWGVPCAYAGVKWLIERQWPDYWFKAMLITGLLSWPPVLYSVLLTRLSPIWEIILAQFSNAGVFTPNLFHIFILMGLPLILAILTLFWLARGQVKNGLVEQSPTRGYLFLAVWFVAGWALSYVPTDFQIHMLNSWQVPIGILATIGLCDHVAPRLTKRWSLGQSQKIVSGIFLLLIVLTNVYLLLWRSLDLNRHEYPYFLHRNDVVAIEWLGANTPVDAIVLSSYDVGRYIPGLSGRSAFLGHWAQTVNFFDKRDRVSRFFDAQTNDVDRLETLQTFGVDYVLYGPAERMLGSYDPDLALYLDPVFSTPQVIVYRVNLQSTLGLSENQR
ncbi:MAG: hypothetical protein GY832_02980 [Chloroflexi bacterium]|nr:hypothetical protein [Chloroflexota bacterium]